MMHPLPRWLSFTLLAWFTAVSFTTSSLESDEGVSALTGVEFTNISQKFRPQLSADPDDVHGPDENKDGVRDDIALFIDNLDVTPRQTYYLMVYAAGVQKEVTYTPDSLADPEQHARDMAKATVCVLSSFEDLEQAITYHQNVQNYTANTKERARRLFEYSTSRNGTVVRLPHRDVCTYGDNIVK